MGDRALIQLKDNSGELSPVLYLHWGGSDVANILSRAQDRMRSRGCDLPYSFARLVQEAVGADTGNTGFGVWNQTDELAAKDSHGDAGCFVVNISSPKWSVAAGGGYGLEGEHGFAVTELD